MVTIAQLAERRIVVPNVVGSSPTSHPKQTGHLACESVLIGAVMKSRCWVKARYIPTKPQHTCLFLCSKHERRCSVSAYGPYTRGGRGTELTKRVTEKCTRYLLLFTERWLSGLKRHPAKVLVLFFGPEGSNPSASAKRL